MRSSSPMHGSDDRFAKGSIRNSTPARLGPRRSDLVPILSAARSRRWADFTQGLAEQYRFGVRKRLIRMTVPHTPNADHFHGNTCSGR